MENTGGKFAVVSKSSVKPLPSNVPKIYTPSYWFTMKKTGNTPLEEYHSSWS